MCFDDGPYQVGYTSDRNEKGLDGEEVADLVDRKPDGWQTAEPE